MSEEIKEGVGESKSAAAWREWFDRLGASASAVVINATANLVILERDFYARPLLKEVERLASNETVLLCAIEAVCHAWNVTPVKNRTPEMEVAINRLSGAHQDVMRRPPRGNYSTFSPEGKD